jgi:cytochrome c oxidase subunit 4
MANPHLSERQPDDGRGHATIGVYNLLAVILFLVTILEVGVLYPPLSSMPDIVRVSLLVGLSVAKFAAVVAFFMHLYYDHPICTGLFLLGLSIAVGTIVALMHLLPPEEHPLQVIRKDEVHSKEDPKFSARPPVQWMALNGVRA